MKPREGIARMRGALAFECGALVATCPYLDGRTPAWIAGYLDRLVSAGWRNSAAFEPFHGKQGRRRGTWSWAERLFLQEAWRLQVRPPAIALALGRSLYGVHGKVTRMQLGRRRPWSTRRKAAGSLPQPRPTDRRSPDVV